MKKIRANNFTLLLIFFLLAGCAQVNPPSKTLDDYMGRSEIEEELVELYFYPTTVRMLDKFISNGEGGILDGVKEGRLFYTNSDSMDILQRDSKELKQGLISEGFELLVEFRRGDMNTTAYVRDLSIDRYVLLIGGADASSTMLVELKGEISMETLQGLSYLNSTNVMSLLDMTKGVPEEPEDVESLKKDNEGQATADSSETIKIEI